jgi:hypothetical protein
MEWRPVGTLQSRTRIEALSTIHLMGRRVCTILVNRGRTLTRIRVPVGNSVRPPAGHVAFERWSWHCCDAKNSCLLVVE